MRERGEGNGSDKNRGRREKKKKLIGRKERIVENWTWKERKMRWRLEEIAREEEGKGRKVWVGDMVRLG